jgi:tRNA modification GTPase
MPNETIAAIATARGIAALAVVRMTGPSSIEIANQLFDGADLANVPSHTVHVGEFRDPQGDDVDQVVVTVFKSPRSVTSEDVVEISCHGGDRAQQIILRALLDSGARLAEPGEFTQRAFLNGKMDLAQAEAVADLIHAHSALAHRVSLSQLHGRYSDYVSTVRNRLVEMCSLVELELDFSEEDVEFANRSTLLKLLSDTRDSLLQLLGSAHLGTLIRDGVSVVIGGRPNAGKSTLLNALLGKDRAIVSDMPGTTRDEIEAEAEIEGLLFRFVDTAGLRETSDAIEAEGVRRTHQAIERSSILLYVYDVTRGLDAEEKALLGRLVDEDPEFPVIQIANKADLDEQSRFATEDLDPISAKEAIDDPAKLSRLKKLLVESVHGTMAGADASIIVTNERHRQHLGAALEAVESAQSKLDAASGDILALDLRRALDELGAITGEVTSDDILGEIFGRFCIGK